jgi:tRNA-dihydrouridine synthase C
MITVTAKMRLGVNDPSRAVECAQALADGGAEELVVHARTKLDGYRPPAHWEWIHAIRTSVRIPVVANGEIWTLEDARRCRDISGCDALMLGRGMVCDPGLALAIAGDGAGAPVAWTALLPLLQHFGLLVSQRFEPRTRAGRIKQWLNYLRRRHPEAQVAYAELRTVNDPDLLMRYFSHDATCCGPTH